MSAAPALAIVPTTPCLDRPRMADFDFLAHHMRPDEIAQHCALRGIPVSQYDPEQAVRSLAAQNGMEFAMVAANGAPIAAGGFDYLRPGVFECWAIGTPAGWQVHWRPLTTYCRQLIDELLRTDAHRVQTVALASRTAAHEWYERGLRMQREGVLRGFFSDGQDGIMFAKTRAR